MIPPFNYSVPRTLSEACQLLIDDPEKTKVIAGGTDLVISLRKGELTPSSLVDISHLKELQGIEESNDMISIGAAVSHADIASSPILRRYGGILSEAAGQIGSPQIRNLGTLGGNIVNASPAADSLPPLLVFEAAGKLISIEGERVVPVSRLIVGPYRTALKPHEILTRISFKKIPKGMKGVFIRLARREAMAIARMSLALLLQVEGNRIQEVRIAPGAVFPSPQRLTEVEDFLKGRFPDEDLLKEASKMVSEAMIRRSGIRPSTSYKEPVIEALFIRAMKEALRKDP